MAKNEWVDVSHEIKKDDGWEDVSHELSAPKPSMLGSAIRKSAQGAVFGMSDELAGVTESIGRAAGIRGAGGPIMDLSIDERGPTLSGDDLKAAYQQGRDEERARLKLDSKTNPITSNVAEIGTAILSPVNKIAKGMSLVGGGALLGGAQGLGSSERESTLGNIGDAVVGAGVGAIIGKGAEKLSKAIAPASEKIADKISKAEPVKNVQEIIAAADRLGIKVTPAMLDNTQFVQRLEYALSESPSIFGQSIAKNKRAVIESLKDASSKMTDDATNLSKFELGEKFKSDLTSKVGERLDPISAVFDDVAESTKHIPLSVRAKDAYKSSIQKMDNYALTEGAGKPSQYMDMLDRAQNVDQIKSIMTMLNADIRGMAPGAEKQTLLAMKEKLARFETNSTMRAARAASKDGEVIGREIVGDLKEARKGYRGLIEDLSGTAETARIKTEKGPTAFLDAVESIPSERIQEKFFNVSNNRQLMNIKEKFPDLFNLTKSGKIADIRKASLDPAQQVSTAKFLNEVNKLNPEAQQMLFGDKLSIVKDLQTIQNSLPRNFNPSGTASAAGWQEALYKNVKDIPNYLLYKGASTNLGKKAVQKLQTPDFTGLQNKTAGAIVKANTPAVIGSGVAASSGVKGIEKWIANGQNKIIENDASIDPAFLDKYKNTKEGRDALIRAGDLKPGSNGLNQTIDKIKNSEMYKQHLKQKEKSAQGKEPDQSKAAPQEKFPKVVRKDGYTAVVRNMDDLAEAKSEGWA